MIDNTFFKTKNEIIHEILKENRGQLLFQEQIMEILPKVFNVEKYQSYNLMKELTKKSQKGLNEAEKILKEYPQYKEEIDQMKMLSHYLFCKAHAISYVFANYLQWS